MSKYLDDTGLTYLWSKLKAYFQPKLVSGTNIKTINNTSLLGSGNITISSGASGTATPTANTISKFDSSAHMNSEDMSSADVASFVEGLNISTASIVNIFYPVGSYYETSDTSFDPNTSWGGTWELETEGQVHIGAGSNYTVGATGGEATHTLNVNEIPSHSHGSGTASYISGSTYGWAQTSSSGNHINYSAWDTSSTGGSGAHNNMQPYIVVNRWHRTA